MLFAERVARLASRVSRHLIPSWALLTARLLFLLHCVSSVGAHASLHFAPFSHTSVTQELCFLLLRRSTFTTTSSSTHCPASLPGALAGLPGEPGEGANSSGPLGHVFYYVVNILPDFSNL